MKYLRNNLKVIIGFIIGVVLASSITVYAYNYLAKDISYIREGTNIKNVAEALNDLYNKSNSYFASGLGNFDNNGSMLISELEFRPQIVFVYTERTNEVYSMWYRKIINNGFFRYNCQNIFFY